ncbi:MAG: AbrB family transcriptional regulator [Methyloligellaceae bacterium]
MTLLLKTLVLGTIGAVIAHFFNLPAAILAGSLGGVALLAIFGVQVSIDNRIRQMALIAVAILIGSSVSPRTLETLFIWPISTGTMLVSVACMMVIVPTFLVRHHKLDTLTARLATVPGALTFVLAISEETNADKSRIAILQTMRLAALMILFPVVVGLTLEPTEINRTANGSLSWPIFLSLFAGGVLLTWLMRKVNWPAAAFMLVMIASGALYGTNVISGGVPDSIVWPALIITGSAIGARFSGVDRQYLLQSVGMGLSALAIAIIISLVFAFPISYYFALPLAQVWLAFAPGGIDTMTVLAFALGVDPAFVAGHQLIRLLCLNLCVPFLFRRKASIEYRDQGK